MNQPTASDSLAMPVAAPLASRVEWLRRAGVLGVTLWWAWAFEWSRPEALLLSPVVDALAVCLLVWLASRRGSPWPDTLLWAMLSRRLHLDAAQTLEGFGPIVAVVWVGWGTLFALVREDRSRYLLLWYHVSLLFDTGVSRSAGMGMPIGWEGAPLNLLCLSGALHALSRGCPMRPVSRLDLLPLGLLAWLTVWHTGPASAAPLTGPVLGTLASALLFWFCCLPHGWNEPGAYECFLAGGLPLALVAFGMAVSESPDLTVVLQKRWFAGGLHPNLFGTWALAALFLSALPLAFASIPPAGRRVARGFGLGVAALTLYGAGSRAGLVIFCLITAVFFWRQTQGVRRIAFGLGLVTLGAVAAWRVVHSSPALEWVQNERLFIWQAAWRAVWSSPWIGHGVLPFTWLSQWLPPESAVWVYDWNYPHAHQVPLEMLLWGGFPFLFGLGWALLAWIRRVRVPEVLLAASGLGLLSLFDFPWFSPSLLLLVMPFWLSGEAVSPGSGRSWSGGRGLLVGFLLVGMAVQIPLARGFATYREALQALEQGKAEWAALLDRAVSQSPGSVEMRLQRLLWRWGTGSPPASEDRVALEALTRRWPQYYLPRFLLGRVLQLGGNASEALPWLRAAVDLEPRDTTGIRWGTLALASRQAGHPWEEEAWMAIQRPEWGSGLVLDHPVLASEAREALSRRWRQAPVGDVLSAVPALRAARALQRRGAASLTLDLSRFVSGPVPSWLAGDAEVGMLQERALSRGAASTLASVTGRLPSAALPVLLWMGEQADRQGRLDLVASVAARVAESWPYRSKNDEDLWTPFWMTRSHLAAGRFLEAETALHRLLQVDPANPWLLLRLGEVHAAAGRSGAARETWEDALRAIPSARRDPAFASGPRELLSPAGDQWTYLFERALRRFDPVAPTYHAAEWQDLTRSLQGRLRAPLD